MCRQLLCSELWQGSGTGPSGPWSTGSRPGIVGQIIAITPPSVGQLEAARAPRPLEPFFLVCSRWQELLGPPHHNRVTGPGFPCVWGLCT